MTTKQPYQLFISSKCSCCDAILALLKDENITLPIINVDKEEYTLPFSIVMFPALTLGENLLSYGCDDIIAQLKKA